MLYYYTYWLLHENKRSFVICKIFRETNLQYESEKAVFTKFLEQSGEKNSVIFTQSFRKILKQFGLPFEHFTNI